MKNIISIYRNSFSNLQSNIWILGFITFINRSGAMVIVFTSLYLTNDLHYSIADAGVIMSFYGIGSVLGAYTGGWLTDRYNFYDIMIFSLISCGLILLSFPFVTSNIFLSAIIFIYAFTCDMFRPANAAAIAAYSTPDNRTRSVSLIRLAINLGFSIGPAIGGFIAMYVGYKWLFIIDSATSVGAAIGLMIYLPRKVVAKNKDSKAILNDSSTSAYRDFKYLFFIVLVALYAISFFQIFVSIPQYLSNVCKYNEDTIGMLMALNGLLIVVLEMPIVAFLEKKNKGFAFIIAGALCISVSYFVLVLGQNSLLAIVMFIVIMTCSETLAMPFMMNYSLSHPKKERQGQYSALYSIAWGLGFIFAPLIGPGITDHFNFSWMFYFFIGLGLLTALGFSFHSKKQPFKK